MYVGTVMHERHALLLLLNMDAGVGVVGSMHMALCGQEVKYEEQLITVQGVGEVYVSDQVL